MLEARGIYKYYVDNNKHKKLILKDCNIKIEKNVSIDGRKWLWKK